MVLAATQPWQPLVNLHGQGELWTSIKLNVDPFKQEVILSFLTCDLQIFKKKNPDSNEIILALRYFTLSSPAPNAEFPHTEEILHFPWEL